MTSPSPGSRPGLIVFGNGDEKAFARWNRDHDHAGFSPGFVLNTLEDSPWEMRLHQAGCKHLDTSLVTTNAWVKVCSERREELVAWAQGRWNQEPARCKVCCP